MEFDLIARIRDRAKTRPDVVLGIGDDAALLQPPPGLQLAVAMDTLNAGVHFPAGTAPSDIGWKALAVNLSDLAAMGARPAWCTLSLSLPDGDAGFVDAFLDGFLQLACEPGRGQLGEGRRVRGVHGLEQRLDALPLQRRDGVHPGERQEAQLALEFAFDPFALLAVQAVPLVDGHHHRAPGLEHETGDVGVLL